ncbi:MAG: Eco57I restriction-modification methylase domain-containing protein, partial [Prevotellaceae bacterium]|nr:Eco57I restriction-modification methylase domain-containing protein [Prevotellaceae bacterium]
MDKNSLQTIFQTGFDAGTWQDLLVNLFGADSLRKTPEKLDASTTNETAFYLGKIAAPDAEIGLFYYQINHGSVVHKRVGLRKLVESFVNPRWGVFGAALVVFDDRTSWRVSLISDLTGESTAPKRFTYVFGDADAYYHTAVNRFLKLQSDGVSLKTLMEAFSVESLTKEFYRELFGWYQWALSDEISVTYPNDTSTAADDRIVQEHLIRLITRLMFVWFIKQKKLIPEEIFDINQLPNILTNFDPDSTKSGIYYNAILQNLFFATLNRPINERGFAANSAAGCKTGKEHYGIKTLYRDDNKKTWFIKPQQDVIKLFRKAPFLNGGLFECLDKEKNDDGKIFYYDGFSREKGRQKRAFLPNCLFFDSEKGLISILKRYNFTIEENTPTDADVALDPELLGKVFENLLGYYNPETKDTARKQSGSFYTPREIVSYMVDESIRAYLQQAVSDVAGVEMDNYASLPDKTKQEIYSALLKIKILDPACGSGAFPMGVLNRMIEILKKLTPDINIYKTKLDLIENCIYGVDIQTIAIQICKLRFFISLIVEQTPTDNRDTNYGILPLPNLESKFIAANTLISLDENKKGQLDLHDETLQKMKNELWEIRNHRNLRASSWQEKVRLRKEDENLCKQIADYLIKNTTKPDEMRIAESRILIEKYETEILELEEEWVDDYEAQMSLFGSETQQKLVRKDINKPKRDKLIERVKLLKLEIQKEERKAALTGLEAVIKKMTAWNPYDQNKTWPFFDPEWMFGLTQGVDIVIGNPPYIQLQNNGGELAKLYENCEYKTFARTGDIYCLFYERGYRLLKPQGRLCFITSNKWMRAGYGENTRSFFAENTNPEQLIDFAGVKVFESATVDTNILMFAKDKNRQQTQACVVKKEGIKDLSVFFRQASSACRFGAESWVILSPIEQRIKAKIEAVGTPLKDWDISINYGIKTGFNDAFIISGEKR